MGYRQASCFELESMLSQLDRIPQAWDIGSNQPAIDQPEARLGRIIDQIEIAVQVAVAHVWTAQRKAKSGGDE